MEPLVELSSSERRRGVFLLFGCFDCSDLMRGHDEDGPRGVLADVVGDAAEEGGDAG
jgi:hypothetical protein